ncbi:hypothetical protein [Streptomyces soliscabiei]|uniref:hypothetical protein n=1 Tax=Streptomyces soliscabiei TaxID=588897 RepID=UPI0029BD37BA|nr:hypothetical protein [Streptomyces sp. NY05-11A]MDX2680609.1 hypothetical protein [Streptomyces sp. NY05-11A]
MTDKSSAGVAATAALLQRLLSTTPQYMRTWRVHGQRARGEMNQRAVARVLAQVEYERGDISDPTDPLVIRRLKNSVHRAIAGQSLPGQLLADFIEGFDMTPDDQGNLWRTLTGSHAVEGTIRTPRAHGKRQWHRTLSLFEHWHIDERSALSRRRTVQCVEALEDGVDSYLYNHEPHATQIDVIHGGRLGRHYEYGEGLISDDIVLDRVLGKGERASLEYQTFYEPDRRVTEVRRPARKRTYNPSLHVHFPRNALPRSVWFAVWEDHYLGMHIRETPLALSDSGTAAYCLDHMEQTVIGFRWEW